MEPVNTQFGQRERMKTVTYGSPTTSNEKIDRCSIELLLAEVRLRGVGPLLKRVKEKEPMLGTFILAAGTTLWNYLERIPMPTSERERIQMETMATVLITAALALDEVMPRSDRPDA